MPRRAKNHKKKLPRKIVILTVAVLLALVAVGLYYLRKRNTPKVSPTPAATIHQLPAQPAANNGEKSTQASSGTNKGTVADNQGQAGSPVNTSPSQWTTSASGVITVKQPISSATIKSGVQLAGTATVSKIQYRLIDNQSGVVSEGFINVVNGNFSGNISFQSHSSSGRLDVFTATDTGVESNEVQIPVNF
jgi:hypothetical protein